MLKASGTVASPWGSQGKSCKSEITHVSTNLAPLGGTSRSRGGVEKCVHEPGKLSGPESTSPPRQALEGLIREEPHGVAGDEREGASVLTHLALFY